MVDPEKVKALSKNRSVWGRGKTVHWVKVLVAQGWRSKFNTQKPYKGRRKKTDYTKLSSDMHMYAVA